jgi:hypothetical protein
MSAATEQTRLAAECRQDDLRSEAEALTWRLYMAEMRAPEYCAEARHYSRLYDLAMQRLFRRFGGEDAYWESVAFPTEAA